MKYLIDTSVISDTIKQHFGVAAKIYSLPPDLIAVSTISIMELEYGLALDPRKEQTIRPPLSDFIKDVRVLPFTEEDATQAGILRAALKKQGKQIGAYDTLLAGCALSRNLIFVTSNTNEFSRVAGLTTEDWRSP